MASCRDCPRDSASCRDSRPEAKSHGQSLQEAIYQAEQSRQEARDRRQSRWEPTMTDSHCRKSKFADSSLPCATITHYKMDRLKMKATTLAVVCVFMTLAMALSAQGYGYVPYYGAQQESNPLGIGQGGLLMLFGVLFLFLTLLGPNSLFNTTSSSAPTVNIIQG